MFRYKFSAYPSGTYWYLPILPVVAVLYNSRYCMFRYKFSAYPSGTYWYLPILPPVAVIQ
jgi:hypothetical protein